MNNTAFILGALEFQTILREKLQAKTSWGKNEINFLSEETLKEVIKKTAEAQTNV